MKSHQPWFANAQNVPWKAWSDCVSSVMNTTLLATELAVASQQTIAYRLALMGRADWPSRAADRRELQRMGEEKLTAASRAAEAWSGDLPAIGQQFMKLLSTPWDLATAMVAVNSLETAADISHAQQHCCDAVLRSQRVVLDFWSSAARAAEGPLRHYQSPIKRRRPAEQPLH